MTTGSLKIEKAPSLLHNNGKSLEITQRMRTEHQQMHVIIKNLVPTNGNYCLLLAVTSPELTMENLQNTLSTTDINSISNEKKIAEMKSATNKMKNDFIEYLKIKQAAGVVTLDNNVGRPGTLHIFPRTQIVEQTMGGHAGGLWNVVVGKNWPCLMVLLQGS